ncbi:MAG: gamma-glutamyltransferase [Kofleriaceae bacterium]
MKLARVALVLIVVACSRRPPPPPPPPPADGDAGVALVSPPAAGDASTRPVYRTDASTAHTDPSVVGIGKTFMVSSEAGLATEVGRKVLAAGGNAVDAAVATAFALAVVHPTAGNIGGGGFAVVRLGPGKATALDFREVAPAAATRDMFLDASGNPTKESLVGYRASGVPGSVAGLWALHKKYGSKPWKELVDPAFALARVGFAVDDKLAESIERGADRLQKFPSTAAIWVPGGRPLAVGAIVKLPQLATVLERIRDRGSDGFYKGETARAIEAAMKAGGGIITAADLGSYAPVWRAGLRFSYRGHSIVSMPPPSSGGIVLAMTAGMLRKVEIGKLPWNGVEHIHWMVEAWRRAFAARNELLGDPTFRKDMPITTLMSPSYLDKLAATIGTGASKSSDVLPLLEGNHTTNLCTVDGKGMAVALTTTINTSWGSGVTVLGFLMNNEMDDFSIKPGSANVFGLVQGEANKIEPGKRMLSSMSPTIVENAKGELVMLAGAGGGPRIISAVWQTISNVIDFGNAAGKAVGLQRFHHQHLPDLVFIEPEAIDEATEGKLRALGYALKWGQSPREFGAVTAIVRTPGGWEGTSDPRGGGAALGD